MKYYLSIIIIILNFSCKTDKNNSVEKSAEFDSQKTKALITQILEDESKNYLSSTCISEKARANSHPMVADFDNYIKKLLKIKNENHYETQKKRYIKFKITSDLVPNKNILTEKQFNDFERKSKNGKFSFWDWLETNCTNGYCSISKPIFNEAYNLAYVQIGTVCGGLCGFGEERIYELVNKKWIKKQSLGSWVS
ncbi:MAG: hypothetical protein MK202_02290 [Tenacibaculum sp.]|nr:hypothetical protein [Tenacibaculum sp.]